MKTGYTAWGETRTFPEWKKDPRVAEGLKSNLLCTRIARGWNVEKSLSTPVSRYAKKSSAIAILRQETGLLYHTLRQRLLQGELGQVVRPLYTHTHNKITAWGETKHLWEWVGDSRKNVEVTHSILRRRIYDGWCAEDALSMPRGYKRSKKQG